MPHSARHVLHPRWTRLGLAEEGDGLRLDWDEGVTTRIRGYLASKPQGSHGKFDYERATPEQIAHERARFRTYQEYFRVPNEI